MTAPSGLWSRYPRELRYIVNCVTLGTFLREEIVRDFLVPLNVHWALRRGEGVEGEANGR